MRLNKKIAGLAAVLSLTLLPVLPAAAVDYTVEGALSYMDTYSTPAVFGEAVFDAYQIGQSKFTWAPDVSVGWINGRNIGRYEDSRPGVTDHIWLVAGGARFHYGSDDAWYQPLFFSFQPLLHTGRTQALSSSYEFASTLGWQAKHWMVGIRHISNGSFEEPNRGETMVLAGVTF